MKLNHVVLALASSLVTTSAFAEDPKVEIRSFRMAGISTRAAEVCGRVTGLTSEWAVVRVLVDPKSSRPGSYQTIVKGDGGFCLAVVTYDGEADASIWIPGKGEISARGEASATQSSR